MFINRGFAYLVVGAFMYILSNNQGEVALQNQMYKSVICVKNINH